MYAKYSLMYCILLSAEVLSCVLYTNVYYCPLKYSLVYCILLYTKYSLMAVCAELEDAAPWQK